MAPKLSSWKFGDTKKEADELLHLVLSGKKTATSSLYKSYLNKKQLPKIGDKSIILDSEDKERCKILTTKVQIKPFNKITESFARKEGEGDLSLKHWKKVHKDFFSKRTKDFDEETLIVCEEFKIIKTN